VQAAQSGGEVGARQLDTCGIYLRGEAAMVSQDQRTRPAQQRQAGSEENADPAAELRELDFFDAREKRLSRYLPPLSPSGQAPRGMLVKNPASLMARLI